MRPTDDMEKNMFQQIQRVATTPAFGVIALIVTLLAGAFLFCQGRELKTTEAPSRIVSLELAGTKAEADSIIASWEKSDKRWVAINQVLVDFIFIAGYACLLLYMGLASSRRAAAHGLSALVPIAWWAGWTGLVAGAFDCLENVGLLAMLLGKPTGLLAVITCIFATLKFVLAANAIIVSVNAYLAPFIPATRP
jgi:Flp pilus assembly protein TadB